MEHAYLGKDFSEDEIRRSIEEKNLNCEELNDGKIYERVVEALQKGKVIGWWQGRCEWGPRALGNRSILADARNPKMKEIVNVKIKFREPFRPFAPSVLEEVASEYFDVDKEIYPNRFMLMTHMVKEEKMEIIPAVTHFDGSSRLQSVVKKHNSRYWQLIETFRQATGVGLVLNTSFNLRGEPIVNSPSDAIKTFLNSGIDILVLHNFLIEKNK
jgi:carbamoyltransferase